MRQFNVLFRWGWTFLVVVTLGLAGCDGDDGAAGAAGAAGQPGTDGDDGLACWDLNSNGVGDLPDEDINGDGRVDVADCAGTAAKVTPLESCAVCHSDGSFADATAFHALDPIELVSNVAIAVNGADLEVTFDLMVDGALTAGYDTMDRGYRTDGVTRTTISDSLTLNDLGGGAYSITIAGGAAEAAIDNRYLFRVSAGDESTTRVYFYGDFPASPVEDLAISGVACTNCHGDEGIGVHGGYFAAEDGGEPCLACHGSLRPDRDNPGEFVLTPRLFDVAHRYHSSIWVEGGEFHHITYPTYMNNCEVCHAEDAQLATANAMTVTTENCFSCHYSMASWAKDDPADPRGFEEGNFHLSFVEGDNCQLCHDGSLSAAPQTAAEMHNGTTTGRGGIIWDGVDTSIKEGEKFNWRITGIVDDGTNLAISWQADYDGVGVDPCNATAAAGAPVFHGDGNGNIRILRNYAQGDDFIEGQSDTSPGGGVNVDINNDNTTCAGNVATTTIAVDEDVKAERGRVALGGRPRVVSVADPTRTMSVRVPTPTMEFLVGSGDAPLMTRRNVVDTNKCLKCHVGSLYQHGGDRIDNVDTCMLCHNSASNEKNVRVGMGVDASEAYDGKVGETFELKTMVHRIHSANWDWDPARGVEVYNPPYLVYRNRGVYAFAGQPPANWDVVSTEGCTEDEIADGKRRIFGSDDASPDKCEEHHFHAVTYPRQSLNECAACHTDDFMVIPDQTKAMAATTDAGSTDWPDQLDDVLQGAATTACITCHADSASKGHAYQNSWTPQVFPEGRQTIIDAVN